MKTVVSVQDLLERDIKPNAMLETYYQLSEQSVRALWGGGRDCTAAGCPACGAAESAPAFEKGGFPYRLCGRCRSLFVSPRPSDAALVSYYRESAAARFWREEIMPVTAQARQEKLSEPRALWVLDTLAEHVPEASSIVDYSAHGSAVTEALLRFRPELRIVAAHWDADRDYGPATSVTVRPGMLASGEVTIADAILAFDSLDRTADVTAVVASLRDALRPGGLLFVIAPSVSGFDLQVLWDKSPAIVPPDKLNLFSAEGWLARFPEQTWEILEFSTPGMFDVENVRRAVMAEPGHDWPRFIRALVEKDDLARVEFQAYLQQFRLASFARLVIRRL